jgi:hypothetical protein
MLSVLEHIHMMQGDVSLELSILMAIVLKQQLLNSTVRLYHHLILVHLIHQLNA